MLTGMTDLGLIFRHSVDGADLRLRLVFVILTVYGVEIMRSLVCQFLFRFIVSGNTWGFFMEIASVGSCRVESISIRIFDICRFVFSVRVGIFLQEFWSVSCRAAERLLIGDKLVVLDKDIALWDTFRSILIEIFRSGVEHRISTLILDSGKQFLSHLWFMSGKIFTIFWVDIGVGSIGFSF